MTDLNTTTETPETPQIVSSNLLEKLISMHGPVKICLDEQDGWFLKTAPEDRHDEMLMHLQPGDIIESIDAAILSAVEWHNDYRKKRTCYAPISF